MVEHNLSLRPIGENDYSILREGRAIGRIRLADEGSGHKSWHWGITVPLPVQSRCAGRASSMEAAKVEFRSAWVQFYARFALRDIAHWLRHQDGKRERAESLRRTLKSRSSVGDISSASVGLGGCG